MGKENTEKNKIREEMGKARKTKKGKLEQTKRTKLINFYYVNTYLFIRLCICSLFNNAVTSVNYAESNDRKLSV
jgi:hypothetical protein